MDLLARHCPRCQGGRFLHVRRVVDRAYHQRPQAGTSARELRLSWAPRAVAYARPRGASQTRASLGRFELLVCRGCGYTAWYAFELAAIPEPRRQAPCRECRARTSHLSIPSLERLSWRLIDESHITRGLLGREGCLSLSICEPCGRVAWQGSAYHHLEGGLTVAYRLVDQVDRPCLLCRATSALIDDSGGEHDRARIPVAQPARSIVSMSDFDGTRGRFSMRLCRPCGAVEWYARGVDELRATADGVIEELGPPLLHAPTKWPYR